MKNAIIKNDKKWINDCLLSQSGGVGEILRAGIDELIYKKDNIALNFLLDNYPQQLAPKEMRAFLTNFLEKKDRMLILKIIDQMQIKNQRFFNFESLDLAINHFLEGFEKNYFGQLFEKLIDTCIKEGDTKLYFTSQQISLLLTDYTFSKNNRQSEIILNYLVVSQKMTHPLKIKRECVDKFGNNCIYYLSERSDSFSLNFLATLFTNGLTTFSDLELNSLTQTALLNKEKSISDRLLKYMKDHRKNIDLELVDLAENS